MQHSNTHTHAHTHIHTDVYASTKHQFSLALLCLHLLLLINCLAAANRPSSPFHTWEWARARTLGLFI